jgi:hypothetical protein
VETATQKLPGSTFHTGVLEIWHPLVGYLCEDICDPSNLSTRELFVLHQSLQKVHVASSHCQMPTRKPFKLLSMSKRGRVRTPGGSTNTRRMLATPPKEEKDIRASRGSSGM